MKYLRGSSREVMVSGGWNAVQSEAAAKDWAMTLLRQFARAAVVWAAANPVKAAQLAIALAIIGTTLVTTKRLDKRTLKRAARVFL
jgi:hypothetical protein